MGRAPAVIMVARHGARLDQADRRWHLTSPTPYDPPLTYGGWTQARALGARIGGILRAREEEEEEEEETRDSRVDGGVVLEHAGRKRKRKHKIIIHSSPFVRCVQTSVAIGAGIAQFRGPVPAAEKHYASHSGPSHLPSVEDSPRPSGVAERAEELLPTPSLIDSSESIPQSQPAASSVSTPSRPSQPAKQPVAELRLDAFLGEWLSPDYFENITPPPSSVMMVASAKAELLRPGEAIEGANPGKTTRGNFPGGWSMSWNPTSSADESVERTGLASMAALGHALPHRACSSAHRSDPSGSHEAPRRVRGSQPDPGVPLNPTGNPGGYVPPVPTYAISSSDPIPVGYVAHARDACISVSYQWDSMRNPQCWGDGGEYGEAWSAMHRRFRNGLSKTIEWYEDYGTAVNQAAELFLESAGEDEGEEAEAEMPDTVLVLVTHGAGCNALIGALTNQPVLLDIGMASLTMAVRKEGTQTVAEKWQRRIENEDAANPQTQQRNSKKGPVDLGIAEDYEMKFTASTEHLRAGSNPIASSATSPRIRSLTSNSPYRRSAASFSGDSSMVGEEISAATSSAGSLRPTIAGATFPTGGWGLHRSVSSYSALRDMYPSNPASKPPKMSSGLWRSEAGTNLSGSESNSNPNHGGEMSELTNTAGDDARVGEKVLSGRGLDGVNDVELGLELKIADGDMAPEDGAEQQRSREQKPANGTVNGTSAAVTHTEQIKKNPTPAEAGNQKGLWDGGGSASFAKGTEKAVAGMQKRRWSVMDNAAA